MVKSIVALSFALSGPALATQLTLPQLVEQQRPHPVHKMSGRELVPPLFEDTVCQADLIIQGRVTNHNTYLSDDQMDLYTDSVVSREGTVLSLVEK